MDNFIVAVNAVIPMFFFIAVGLFIKYRNLLTDTEIKHFNKMLFQIFFFVMLFYTTYTMNIAQTFRPRLITGPEVLIAQSRSAFDAEGRLMDERSRKGLAELMQILRREAEAEAARRG